MWSCSLPFGRLAAAGFPLVGRGGEHRSRAESAKVRS